VNGQYAFILKKAHGKQWALSEIDTQIDKGVNIPYIKSQLIDQGVTVNYAPFGTGGHGFYFAPFHEAGFSVLAEDRGPDGRMKIVFRMLQTAEAKEKPGPQLIDGTGWIILDPQQYWRICEYMLPLFHKTGNVECYGAAECDLLDGTFPLLRRVVNTYYKEPHKRQKSLTQVAEYQIEKRLASEDEFRLSAFGLPEPSPPRSPGRWSPPYVWLSAAGLLCLSLAFLIRRGKQRESRS
jgi:hypothetical protein